MIRSWTYFWLIVILYEYCLSKDRQIKKKYLLHAFWNLFIAMWNIKSTETEKKWIMMIKYPFFASLMRHWFTLTPRWSKHSGSTSAFSTPGSRCLFYRFDSPRRLPIFWAGQAALQPCFLISIFHNMFAFR